MGQNDCVQEKEQQHDGLHVDFVFFERNDKNHFWWKTESLKILKHDFKNPYKRRREDR